MNKNVILAAVVGLVVGAGAGIAGSCLFLKTKYQKLADEQVDDVKKAFGKRLDIIEDKYKKKEAREAAKVTSPSYSDDTVSTAKRLRSLYDGSSVESEVTIAKKISETRPREDYRSYSRAVETSDTEESEEHPMDSNVNKGPTIISKAEFGNNIMLTPTDLTYYTVDGVLTDEFDNEVDNVLRAVGSKITTSGFDRNDELELYIRNEAEGRDYRITKIKRAFSDEY